MAKVYGILPELGGVPTVPTGLAQESEGVTSSSFNVIWDDAADATSWTVYVNGNPFGPATAPIVFIAGLNPSTAYNIQVQAHNLSGSSALSSVVVMPTLANTHPAWGFSDQTLTVGVAVNISFDDFCNDFDGDNLTYSIVSGSIPGISINSNQDGLTGTPTTAGNFTVVFRAHDGFDSSDTSVDFLVAAVVDTTAPTIPVLSGGVTGSTVNLSWTESTDASGISEYRIRRDGSLLQTLPGTQLTFQHAGVPNGTYSYAVRAVDGASPVNVTNDSNAFVAIVSVAPPAPDTPVYAAISVISSSQLNHSWAAGSSGPAPTAYELDRSLNGTSGWVNRYTGLNLSFNDTGLSASTQYFYRLRALNGPTPSSYATGNATTGVSSGSGLVIPNLPGGPSWPHGIGDAGGTTSVINSGINSFENWIGHEIDIYASWATASVDSWAAFESADAPKLDAALDVLPDTTTVVMHWPMIPYISSISNANFAHPETWVTFANGGFDSHWHAFAQSMVNKCTSRGRNPNTIIFCMGWECSGGWYPWSISTARLAEWKASYVRAADIIISHIPEARFDLQFARNRGGEGRTLTAAQMMPTHSALKTLSRSLHDNNGNTADTVQDFIDSHVNDNGTNMGLKTVYDLAVANGKKFTLSEWSCQMVDEGNPNFPASSNPNAFITGAKDFLDPRAANIGWDLYFFKPHTRLDTRPTTTAAQTFKSRWT